MLFNVRDIFNSQSFHQHVTAFIPAISKVILREYYKKTNVQLWFKCFTITP